MSVSTTYNAAIDNDEELIQTDRSILPRLTKRPSANRIIERPLESLNRSTYEEERQSFTQLRYFSGLLPVAWSLLSKQHSSSAKRHRSRYRSDQCYKWWHCRASQACVEEEWYLDSRWPSRRCGPLYMLLPLSSLRNLEEIRSSMRTASLVFTFHGCLQSVDRIDFGNNNTSSEISQRTRTAFAHITIAGDHCYLASNHDICGALNPIDQRFSASVEIVEFWFRYWVIHIYRRDFEFVLFEHFIQCMNTGGRFFANAQDTSSQFGIFIMNNAGQVATVIENHIQWFIVRTEMNCLNERGREKVSRRPLFKRISTNWPARYTRYILHPFRLSKHRLGSQL